MTNRKHFSAVWKSLLGLPVIALLAVLFSCSNNSGKKAEGPVDGGELNEVVTVSYSSEADTATPSSEQSKPESVEPAPVAESSSADAEEAEKLRKEADKYAAKGEPIPYILLSEKPTFQGGDANTFAKWFQRHLIYPKEAVEKNIQGRVTSQFTIEEDGSISDIRILRSPNEILSKEAIGVINEANSVKWTPSKMDGKPVKVRYTFPVLFMLH